MGAYENAKSISSEEVMAKIASFGLREYGTEQGAVAHRWQEVLTLREEELAQKAVLIQEVEPTQEAKSEFTLIAALNNADTAGVLLQVLQENPAKVFAGMNIAAYATGAEKKVLQLPEYAADLAKSLKMEAEQSGITVTTGLINVRATRCDIVSHIITMAELCELFDESYFSGIYVSVNGGTCKKYPETATVAEILEDAGADNTDVKVYETGYTFSPVSIADKPVTEAGITNGVLNVVTSKDCIIQKVEAQTAACRRQSCGKCVFCREGLIQLHGMMNDIKDGRGKQEYPEIIREIGSAMTFSTPCSMGQESAKLALTSVEQLAGEYEEHIKKKTCPAGVCFNKSVIYIDPQRCEGCEECADVCPVDCIEGKKNFIHMIDEFDCTQCGKCMEACEYDAIIQTNGKLPKLPDRLTKCGKFKKH